MINWPDSLDLEFRLRISRMLYDKDTTIKNLEAKNSSVEQHNKNLLNELNLMRKYYKDYNLLDLNYPKDFGKGYDLADFPDGTFIENGFFIIKRSENK